MSVLRRVGASGVHTPKRACAARSVVTVGLVLALASTGCTVPSTGAGARGPDFEEQFNGTSVDLGRWNTEMPWGDHTSGQLERYTASSLVVSDGRLAITAQSDSRGGRGYVSGTITSLGRYEFTYGYAEIRCRVPAGKGLWPAFWLASSDGSDDEIDVLEILGHEPNRLYMYLHFPDSDGVHREQGNEYRGPDFSAGYHTFAVDWRPDAVIWYVDGVERARQTEGIPHRPMYLIANLGVGGKWPGSPDASTRFPARYDIEWIRVYERTPAAP